jgi:hypothetical protein
MSTFVCAGVLDKHRSQQQKLCIRLCEEYWQACTNDTYVTASDTLYNLLVTMLLCGSVVISVSVHNLHSTIDVF